MRTRMLDKFLVRALARMAPEPREAFEERVAICIYDGGLSETQATRLALDEVARQACRPEDIQ